MDTDGRGDAAISDARRTESDVHRAVRDIRYSAPAGEADARINAAGDRCANQSRRSRDAQRASVARTNFSSAVFVFSLFRLFFLPRSLAKARKHRVAIALSTK